MRKNYPQGKDPKTDDRQGFPLQGNPLYMSLTPNHKRFVYNIFQQPLTRWTNTQCWTDAMGRKTVTASDRVEACRNLKKPKFIELLRLLKDSYARSLHVSSERVLEEESYLAYSDIGEYFDDHGQLIVNPKKLPESARRAIQSFKQKYDQQGNLYYEVTLWSKGNSLKRLQAILGMNAPQALSVNGKITHGGQVMQVLALDLSLLNDKELRALDTIAHKLQTKDVHDDQ